VSLPFMSSSYSLHLSLVLSVAGVALVARCRDAREIIMLDHEG
jgi:hypothetical protein